MFSAPGLIFDGIEGVESRFHVLRSRTHFVRYRGRRVQFSCFARPDSFSAVPRASARIFMFCAPGLLSHGTEVVGSLFHVLSSRTHFRRYRGRRVPFLCFAHPDSFSAVSRPSNPIFMFCASELVSAIPTASGPVFLFCAPGHVFGGAESIGSCFHVLRSRTRFLRYRGRRLPVLFFTRPNSFSTVPTASGPDIIFCSPRYVFGGAEGVGSRFHVLRSRTLFPRFRGRRVPFSCMHPILILGGTEGIRSHFYVLRSQTRFQRYQGHRLPFSCFALFDSFPVVPRASGPIFMFCAPVLIFDGTEGVESHFHVLHSRTRFRRYRGCRVPFSCFALPTSFSAVTMASALDFTFWAVPMALAPHFRR
jgi:hypothetical protein